MTTLLKAAHERERLYFGAAHAAFEGEAGEEDAHDVYRIS